MAGTKDDATTVGRLITHHTDPEHTLRWAEKTGRLAIGWSEIGDIKVQGYTSHRDISNAIINAFPDGIRNAAQGGICLYNFCYRMQPGDLVILSTGGRRALVMEVEGGYEYKSTPEDTPIGYQHQRKARILPMDADALWRCAGGTPKVGSNIRLALIECIKPIDAATRAALLKTRSPLPSR